MYQASEQFNSCILGSSRSFRVKMEISGKTIIPEIRSIVGMAAANPAECVSIGGTASAYVTVTMKRPDTPMENVEFALYIGLDTGTDEEYVKMGLYTVQKPLCDDGILTFTAYDRMTSQLGRAYFSNLTYPADGKSALQEISNMSGVPITGLDNLPDGIMVDRRAIITESGENEEGNPVTTTQYQNPFDGYTYREALGYIAQLYTKFAVINRDGGIELRWYREADYTIAASKYYDDLVSTEKKFELGAIECVAGENTLVAGTGTAGMQITNPVMTQAHLDRIYGQLKDFTFLPVSLSFFGDPRLDLGDIVKVNDKHGNTIEIPLMSIIQDFDGGLLTTIKSEGRTEAESTSGAVKGPTAQAMDRVYSELFLVKEVIGSKASFDYVYSINADFKNVKADYGEYKTLVAGQFTAQQAEIGEISGNFAAFKAGEFESLKSKQVVFESTITASLTAVNGRIDNLTGDFAEYKKIVASDFQTTNGQIQVLSGNFSSFEISVSQELIAAKGWMLEGSIGDAQISRVSANKLTAGTIDTALVNLVSPDSALQVTGSQILINDTTDPLAQVNRVVLGKYQSAEGMEYGLLVRSKEGNTVMIDGDGVHNAGITDGAIDNNKVADNANISGKKIDIQSVVTEINEGETKISQTVIQVGDKTLEIVMSEQFQKITDTEEKISNIESKKMLHVDVIPEGGSLYEDGKISCTFRAVVYSWDDDITDLVPKENFTWRRESADKEYDAYWNENHKNYHEKELVINADDVITNDYKVITDVYFVCDVSMET